MRSALRGIVAALASAALFAGAAAAKGTEPVQGGAAVVGLENSPACLNPLLSACNTQISFLDDREHPARRLPRDA